MNKHRFSQYHPFRINSLAGLLAATVFCTPVLADWWPFSIDEGSIIIEVELAGQPARALLDTGAERNAIDAGFVNEHGQGFVQSFQGVSRGVNESATIRYYSDIPLKIFDSELTLTDVAAMNLGYADLLLGGVMFRDGILQIDYPGSRLRYLSKDAVDMKKHSNVRMKRVSGSYLPAVQVELNGKKTWLLFDTGNSTGIYLQRDYAKDKGLLTDETVTQPVLVQGVNSVAQAEKFVLDDVKFGPYELEHVSVVVPIEGQDTMLGAGEHEEFTGTRIKTGTKTKGILGYDMLKHFVVTVDYLGYRVNIYAP